MKAARSAADEAAQQGKETDATVLRLGIKVSEGFRTTIFGFCVTFLLSFLTFLLCLVTLFWLARLEARAEARFDYLDGVLKLLLANAMPPMAAVVAPLAVAPVCSS